MCVVLLALLIPALELCINTDYNVDLNNTCYGSKIIFRENSLANF